MKRLLAAFILSILFLGCKSKTSVSSPDASINVRFSFSVEGQPEYAVSVDGKPFIGQSVLGMITSAPLNLKNGFRLESSKVTKHDEKWSQPWGENKEILDRHKELEVRLVNSDCKLTLRLMVFNDGV